MTPRETMPDYHEKIAAERGYENANLKAEIFQLRLYADNLADALEALLERCKYQSNNDVKTGYEALTAYRNHGGKR